MWPLGNAWESNKRDRLSGGVWCVSGTNPPGSEHPLLEGTPHYHPEPVLGITGESPVQSWNLAREQHSIVQKMPHGAWGPKPDCGGLVFGSHEFWGFSKCHCILFSFILGPVLPNSPLPQFCGPIRSFFPHVIAPLILICLAVGLKIASGRNLYYDLFLIFIYLFGYRSWLKHTGSSIFVATRWIFSCSTLDLVSWPGIKSRPPALGVRVFATKTTREVPPMVFLNLSKSAVVFMTYTSFLAPIDTGVCDPA